MIPALEFSQIDREDPTGPTPFAFAKTPTRKKGTVGFTLVEVMVAVMVLVLTALSPSLRTTFERAGLPDETMPGQNDSQQNKLQHSDGT